MAAVASVEGGVEMAEFSPGSTSFGPFLERLQEQLGPGRPGGSPSAVVSEPETARIVDPGTFLRKLNLLMLLLELGGAEPVIGLYEKCNYGFMDFAGLLLQMAGWIEVTGVPGEEIISLSEAGRATAEAFREEVIRATSRSSGR